MVSKIKHAYGRNDGVKYAFCGPDISPLDRFRMISLMRSEVEKYRTYVTARIGRVQCVGMVDSGNTAFSSCNNEVADALGLTDDDLEPVSGEWAIGTAKADAKLTIRGQTKRLVSIHLTPNAPPLRLKLVVLPELDMPLNLSGVDLAEHNVKMHIGSHLIYHGVRIPMSRRIDHDKEIEKFGARIYTATKVTVGPNEEVRIPAVTPDEFVVGKDTVISSVAQFCDSFDLHPWRNAAIHVSRPADGSTVGILKVGVMNTTGHDIVIPAGTFYGEMDILHDGNEPVKHDNPFRMCTMVPNRPRVPAAPSAASKSPPTKVRGTGNCHNLRPATGQDKQPNGQQQMTATGHREVGQSSGKELRSTNNDVSLKQKCSEIFKNRRTQGKATEVEEDGEDKKASISKTDGSRVTKARQEEFNLPPPPDKQTDPMVGDEVDIPDWMRGNTTDENMDNRVKHLCGIFDLAANPNLKTADDLCDFVGLLLKHWTLFSWDGQYGKTHLVKHYIKTKPGIPPVYDKHRFHNQLLDESARKQLLKWLEYGVIEPSDSPWNSNLLPVVKASGGKDVRWTVDYRKLNDVTEIDRFPIGNIEDNLSRLSESSLFSALDNAGAFHVIEIAEEDRPKTSFSSPFNCWQFTRMPFGLSGGPSSYARLVVQVLRGIPQEAAVAYVDDVLIHSDTFSKHIENLDRVMTAYQKAGLKLNPAKCTLLASKVNYLGHTVTKEGLAPQENYLDIISKWPLPTTRGQVQTLLGKIGYYNKFIPDYAKVVKPLTDVLKISECADNILGDRSRRPRVIIKREDNAPDDPSEKLRKRQRKPKKVKKEPLKLSKYERKKIMDAPIKPTPEFIAAFHEVKKRLVNAPILAHPRFKDIDNEPFILDTDWCKDTNTISGCLSQRRIINGEPVEKVIGYAAKKLNQSQANYSAQKGELCAIIYMTAHFQFLLRYGKFEIRTDSTAAKALKTTHDPTGMMARWRQRMAQFDFDIYHRAGDKHGNADALSRVDFLKHDPEDDIDPFDEKMDRQTVFVITRKPKPRISDLNADKEAWTPSVTKNLQIEDHDLNLLRQWVHQGKKPSTMLRAEASQDLKSYLNLFESLFLDGDDVLRYSRPEYHPDGSTLNTRDVIILPRASLMEAIRRIHERIGHLGVEKTLQAAMRNVHGHRMKEATEAVVKTCLTCQAKGGKPGKSDFALNPPRQGYAFQMINCDIVGPLVKSRQGHEYLLTVECMFTRWLEAFPLRRPTGLEVAHKLATEVFPRFGYPDIIKVDNGTHFKNHTVQELMDATGIKVMFSPPYHPSSNPVERQHRTLKSMLTAMLTELAERRPNMWEDFLPAALFAMRTMVNSSTGHTPFQLMFGRQASTDLDMIFGTPPHQDDYEDYRSYAKAHSHHVQAAYRWANNNISTAIKRARRYYYNNKERSFKPGDEVWLLTPIIKPGQRKSFLRPYTGPWTVVRKINEVTYEIKPHPLWSRKTNVVASIDRLKPYVAPEGETGDPKNTHPPGINDDLTLPGDDHLEDIMCEPEDDKTTDLTDDPDCGPVMPEHLVPDVDITPLPAFDAVPQPENVPEQAPENVPRHHEQARPQPRAREEQERQQPRQQDGVRAPAAERQERVNDPDPVIMDAPPVLPDFNQADEGRPEPKHQKVKTRQRNPRLPSTMVREHHARKAKTHHKYVTPRETTSLSVEKPSLDLTDQSKVMQNRQKHAASQHDVHKAKRLHYAQQQLLDDHAEHRFRQALHRPSSIHGSTPPSAARAGRQLLGQRKRR